MKKILLLTLASALPLTSFLNQANSTLKSHQLLSGEWIENEQVEKEKSHVPQLFKNNTNIYSNKQIEIDLIKDDSNKSIAMINAKKAEKKYYLKLNNNHLHSQKQLENFIIEKFYSEKTSERFIPSERFYSFLDTKDNNGEITQNGTIEFRSSWGVYNEQEVDSSIKFNFREEKINEYIWMHDHNNLPKGTRPNHIQVQTIQPKKIGLLPIAQIYQPPIRDAKWTTRKISFNDSNNYYTYRDDSQYLDMPEGHDSGLEWWKGITSSLGVLAVIMSGGLGAIFGAKIAAYLASKSIMVKFIAGALVGASSMLINILGDKLSEVSIKDGIATFKKLYELIVKNQIYIHPNKIDFNNMKHAYLSVFVDGKVWARANATSIWGITSKMDLHSVWAAANSDVCYRIYK